MKFFYTVALGTGIDYYEIKLIRDLMEEEQRSSSTLL